MSSSQMVNVGSIGVTGGVYAPVMGTFTTASTENNAVNPVRTAGTIKTLYTYVSSGPAMMTMIATLRKNNADTSLTVTYSTSQTGIKEDTVSGHNVSVITTDKISYGFSGVSSTTFKVMGVQFQPTTGTVVVMIMCARGSVSTGTAQTTYNAVNGDFKVGTTEAPCKLSVGQTFTASNLYTSLSINNWMGTTTFKSRVNGVDGAMSTSYTLSQTGIKEDTTNTDALSIGDDFNYALTLGSGSGTITAEFVQCVLTKSSVTNTFFPLMASSTEGVGVAFNTTTYCGCAGDLLFTTTEADTQIRPRFTFTAAQLGAYATANTIATSDSTVTVRDAGVDSIVTVSFSAAQTGLQTDNTNSTIISSAANFVNYKVVTPNTSGTLTLSYIGLLSKAEGVGTNLFVRQAINRAATY